MYRLLTIVSTPTGDILKLFVSPTSIRQNVFFSTHNFVVLLFYIFFLTLHFAMCANGWHCANIIIGQIDCKKQQQQKNMLTFSTNKKKPTVGVRCCDLVIFSELSKGIYYLIVILITLLVVKKKKKISKQTQALLYLHSIETLQAQLITHAHHYWILKENLLLYSYDVISYDYLWKVKYYQKIKI